MDQPAHGIDVDLQGLRLFAVAFRTNLDQVLIPGAAHAQQELPARAELGHAIPGGNLRAARDTLLHALELARDNIERQVAMAQTLSTALDHVLENYARGDEDAATNLSALELQK